MSTTDLATASAPPRCDRCPAAARVRVELRGGEPSGGGFSGGELRGGELLFCAHHTREHHVSLLAIGATLVALKAR